MKKLNKNIFGLLLILVIPANYASAKTITLYPDKDARLYYRTRPGYTQYCDMNFGNSTLTDAWTWTESGYTFKIRGIMGFNLNEIPAGSQITSATLYLYGYYHRNNITESGRSPNNSYLQRITQPWDEYTVTWNNQPPTTTANQVELPNSTSSTQDYAVNVTNLIQDMVNDPLHSHGLLLRLVTESIYRCMSFYSSDYSDPAKHPKLVITYTSNYSIDLTETKNYVHAITPRVATTSIPANGSRDVYDYAEAVQYNDGFARPLQNIAIKSSPSGIDIIGTNDFDPLGRQTVNYMPYTIKNETGGSSTNGAFRPDALSGTNEQQIFYDQFYPGQGAYANAEKDYDNSPYNRVIEAGSPGSAWRLATDNTIKSDAKPYFNTDIPIWEPVDVYGNTQTSGLYYGVNTYTRLIVTEIEDEDENTARTYTNSSGQVILKEADNGAEVLKTLYLYDNFGRLRYIVPPKAMDTNPASLSKTSPIVTGLCYYYEYDARGRVIEKREPSAESVYIVYDLLNRPVLTQDGVQRINDLWTFTKYDKLGRIIISGIHYNTGSRQTLQNVLDGGAYDLYEERGAVAHGYTRNAFPTYGIQQYLQISYYDNYSGAPTGYAYTIPSTSGFTSGEFSGFETSASGNTSGRKTYAKTAILNPIYNMPDWLYTFVYYDDKGRVIQTVGDNHLNGLDRISFKYDFTGNVLATIHEHLPNDANLSTIKIGERYTYDHRGRILKQYHQIANETEVLMCEYTYNELGQLTEKRIHSTNSGKTYAQQVDYSYNLQGWLASINNPHNLGNDLFGMELTYEDVSGLGDLEKHAKHNGNITGVIWKNSQVTNKKAYAFNYDGLNRLEEADYGEGTSSISDIYSYNAFGIAYDKNGNIEYLRRLGNDEDIDDLTYQYETNSNKLTAVFDNEGSAGFHQTATTTPHYTYDVNGNMIRDENKKISISYNHLNLPYEVRKDGYTSYPLKFIYDAAGNLLASGNNHDDIYIYYAGSFVYYYYGDCYEFAYILTPEGRITKPTGSYVYEYHLKDHLGNTRVAFDATASGPVVKQVSDYYPFGMRHEPIVLENDNKYLYNGKEFFEKYDFDMYYFGARMYDPVLGRWHSVDPKGSLRPYHSPYMAMGNDPINNIDPDGEFFLGTILTGVKEFVKTVGGTVNEVIEAAFFDGGLDFSKGGKKYRQQAWNEAGDQIGRNWSNFDPSKPGTQTNNAWRIDIGGFKTDENRNFVGRYLQLLSRWTRELPQTLIGKTASHARNITGNVDNVDYYGGATLVNKNDNSGWAWGFTLGPYINSKNVDADPYTDRLFRHEYGHTLQSRLVGLLYLFTVAPQSLIGSGLEDLGINDHNREWYETQANRMSHRYFQNHDPNALDPTQGGRTWDDINYPRTYDPSWYWFFSHPPIPLMWWLFF